MNKLIKASLIRSLRTFLQSLAMTLPMGTVITPALIQSLDWSFLYIVLAWIVNALFISFGTFLTCVVGGLPEANEEMIEEDEEVEDEEDERP